MGTAELAMRRFGLDTRLHGVAKPADALDHARRPGAVSVAALDASNPWWARLIAEPRLRAFDLLRGPKTLALCLAELAQEPEGDDQTLWATDAGASYGAIESELGRAGFAGERVWSGGGLKLFALAGYVQRDDPRLLAAPGRLSGVIGVIPNASLS